MNGTFRTGKAAAACGSAVTDQVVDAVRVGLLIVRDRDSIAMAMFWQTVARFLYRDAHVVGFFLLLIHTVIIRHRHRAGAFLVGDEAVRDA